MRFSKIFRLRLGSRIFALKINGWNERLSTYYGISNQTWDGYYIPFWDFVEDITISDVHFALMSVQDWFALSRIHVIQTVPKKSYRAFAYDKLTWLEYVSLLASTPLIDPSYLKHSVMRGRAVIRVTQKPSTENKVVDILDTESNIPKSIDHAIFFGWLYGIPLGKWSSGIRPPQALRIKASKYETFR